MTITIFVAIIINNTIFVVFYYCEIENKRDRKYYKLFEMYFDEFILTQKQSSGFILSNLIGLNVILKLMNGFSP